MLEGTYREIRAAHQAGDVRTAREILRDYMDHDFLWFACLNGHEDMVNLGTALGMTTARHINQGLAGACAGGHGALIHDMLTRGADVNCGLFGACSGGQTHWVNQLIRWGATDWNRGLRGACSGNNLPFIRDMLARGATDVKGGFREACWNGDECCDAVLEMLQWSEPSWWIEGWWCAMLKCERSHRVLIELLLRGGEHIRSGHPFVYNSDTGTPGIRWEVVLEAACRYDLDLVVRVIQRGATFRHLCVTTFGTAALLNADVPVTWFPPGVVQPVLGYRRCLMDTLSHCCPTLCPDVTTLVGRYMGLVDLHNPSTSHNPSTRTTHRCTLL